MVPSRNNIVPSVDSELYSYDDLNRLTSIGRGTLNSGHTSSTTAAMGPYILEFDVGFQGGVVYTDDGTIGPVLTGFQHRDYNPATGRWMQQDPAGYVDSPNLFLFEVGSPIDHLDPSGLRIKIVQAGAANNDPVTNITDLYDTMVKKFIGNVGNIAPAEFDKMVRLGHVTWDGQVFNGTQADYIGRLNREAGSSIEVATNGNRDDFVAKVKSVMADNNQPWDSGAAAVHGIYDPDTNQPTGSVDINGKEYDEKDTLQQLSNVVGPNGFVVACFAKGNEKANIIVTVEGRGSITRGTAEQCTASFTPERIGQGASGATTPP